MRSWMSRKGGMVGRKRGTWPRWTEHWSGEGVAAVGRALEGAAWRMIRGSRRRVGAPHLRLTSGVECCHLANISTKRTVKKVAILQKDKQQAHVGIDRRLSGRGRGSDWQCELGMGYSLSSSSFVPSSVVLYPSDSLVDSGSFSCSRPSTISSSSSTHCSVKTIGQNRTWKNSLNRPNTYSTYRL
jgi:hypothetical protein